MAENSARAGQQAPQIRWSAIVLFLLGVGGILLTLWVALMYTFFAVVKAPSAEEYFLIALHALPFIFYLTALRKPWGKNRTLLIGLPFHLAWIPLFSELEATDELFFVVIAVALVCVSVFIVYAKGLSNKQSP